jgi:hypothetical protein
MFRGVKERLARLEPEHPDNLGVLAYLRGERPDAPAIARPSAVPDPYSECGSHPDIVEHLWDVLGAGLPRAARALVHGGPVLVLPEAGLVVAVGLGTQYALRLSAARLATTTLAARHLYRTSGFVIDLADFGPSWRFGAFGASEREWLEELCVELDGRG